MDPNQALKDIRAMVAYLTGPNANPDSEAFAEQATALANTIEGLDEWLSRGGFKPSDWR